MIKFAVSQWDKNKTRLESHIANNLKDYEDCSYKKLVEDVVRYVFNDAEDRYDLDEYDYTKVTEIDNGDYQGTLLYLIPTDAYQPDETEYLMTHAGYGSCSGCDTLLSLQYNIENVFDDSGYGNYTAEEKDKMRDTAIGDLMTLCLHLVQNTIKPYNSGWQTDERFNEIEDKEEDIDDGLGTKFEL